MATKSLEPGECVEAHQEKVTLAALAVLTDAVNDPEVMQADLARSELGRVLADNDLTDVDLFVGMMNIATALLVKLEKAGQPIPDVLADVGLRYRRK